MKHLIDEQKLVLVHENLKLFYHENKLEKKFNCNKIDEELKNKEY
jgi:hypothetical protein